MFAFLFGKKEKQVAGAIVNPTADLQAREEQLEKKIRQLEKIKESHHTNAIQQKALGRTSCQEWQLAFKQKPLVFLFELIQLFTS